MFGIERRQAILKLVNEKGNATIAELVSEFGVSAETVRKDLLYLEQNDLLVRTHGGAVIKTQGILLPLKIRKQSNVAEKVELCRYAIRFIENGDVIAIDSGSTAIGFAKLIASAFTKLTVVTHSMEIFQILLENKGIEPILCGGYYMTEEAAFSGCLTVDMIKQLHTKKAFLFPAAVSRKFGIMDCSKEMLDVQRAYIDTTDHVFFLANSQKFETAAHIKLCDMSRQHTYITDSGLSDEIFTEYQKQNFHVVRK